MSDHREITRAAALAQRQQLVATVVAQLSPREQATQRRWLEMHSEQLLHDMYDQPTAYGQRVAYSIPMLVGALDLAARFADVDVFPGRELVTLMSVLSWATALQWMAGPSVLTPLASGLLLAVLLTQMLAVALAGRTVLLARRVEVLIQAGKIGLMLASVTTAAGAFLPGHAAPNWGATLDSGAVLSTLLALALVGVAARMWQRNKAQTQRIARLLYVNAGMILGGVLALFFTRLIETSLALLFLISR